MANFFKEGIKRYKSVFVLVLAIVIFYFFLSLIGVGCPIKFITGISCAGCGMTRAWISILKCDFKSAFNYHPLFLIPIPTALLLIFKNKINRKLYIAGLTLVLILFLAVYVIRLLDPNDLVVVFEPKDGFMFKGYSIITAGH